MNRNSSLSWPKRGLKIRLEFCSHYVGILRRASVHIQERLHRRDFCNGTKLLRSAPVSIVESRMSDSCSHPDRIALRVDTKRYPLNMAWDIIDSSLFLSYDGMQSLCIQNTRKYDATFQMFPAFIPASEHILLSSATNRSVVPDLTVVEVDRYNNNYTITILFKI